MSMLSQRLHVGVAQKQILTPGLVQLVTVLQLNRLELKDMIAQEVAQNPVLEESLDPSEELTPAELQEVLERERESTPADHELLAAAGTEAEYQAERSGDSAEASSEEPAVAATTDPFDEIDFDNYFNDYLEPGFKSPAGENPEKPSWETFASAPVTLGDHLRSQLSLVVMPEEVRDACESVIGNLDDNGYVTATAEEIATYGDHTVDDVEKAIEEVQSLDPAGVGARDVRECLMLQLESRRAVGSVAWKILDQHMKLLEMKQYRDLAKALGRPLDHIQVAVEAIKHLDPRPGLRYSGPGARTVEPDVYIYKDGENYHIELNDDDMPQLRLNRQYIKMLDREQEPNKEVRNYVKDRFNAASMLLKNIEQRKQTILKVCHCIIERQREFLEHGLNQLRPMMIKDLAEEIGVHASTVSRAVAGKYAHTPQGVFELRYFFSEAVQGPSGSSTPLLLLKRMVKKMIEEEDTSKPLTDDQITAKLQAEGINVTRRTVAKYREDLKIPSTHQRRVRD
ncbi:MAG: RNA polymerase sigma-54 factor [Acidobacteriia bacterium 12-62-4]|nr:MAG: RNA polymerase sigma-54 factor [Acidobacteriia bacterium 12-62-4]